MRQRRAVVICVASLSSIAMYQIGQCADADAPLTSWFMAHPEEMSIVLDNCETSKMMEVNSWCINARMAKRLDDGLVAKRDEESQPGMLGELGRPDYWKAGGVRRMERDGVLAQCTHPPQNHINPSQDECWAASVAAGSK